MTLVCGIRSGRGPLAGLFSCAEGGPRCCVSCGVQSCGDAAEEHVRGLRPWCVIPPRVHLLCVGLLLVYASDVSESVSAGLASSLSEDAQ